MKIGGNWAGFYEYGLGFQQSQFGQRVSVRLSLKDVEDGFEGECIEENSEFSIDEVSKIIGFTEENIVSFVKHYKNQYIMDQDEGLKVIEGKQMEVPYIGELSEDNLCMFGGWEIITPDYVLEGQRVIGVYRGIWKLTRILE